MLSLQDLSFAIEGRPLIEGASVTIPTGHKVGFVGRNGTGKSTLFRLITGEWEPDTGRLETPRGARIGGVAQEAPGDGRSLLDTVLEADEELQALHRAAETASDPARIAEIQLRLADIEAHSAEARASAILQGLGFDWAAQQRPSRDFSGGWRMRVALASVLFARPDLLLLDEPTNYLDLEGTIWLENYIARYPYTAIIISHDRQLLNRSVQHILHLAHRKLTLYTGSYDQFDAARRAKAALAEAAAKKQAAQKAHLQSFVDRFRYKASKARQAQSRLKMIERLQPIDFEADGAVSGFSFPDCPELAPPIVRLDGAEAGYGDKPVLRGLNLRIDQDDRIALLGANGQGKSTLSKLIAGRLAPMSGDLQHAPGLKIGYFAQHQLDELEEDQSPLAHLRARRPEEAPARLRARLAASGIGAEIAETEVARLSGGQKARLAMMLATLDAPHLVILDEPTNHLDIESREALVQALTAYSGAVILVSHDAFLVECVADRLWLVDSGKVTPYDEDMEGYRRFLLSRGAPQKNAKKPKPRAKPAERRARLAPLREEVGKCEARIETLEEMRAAIDEKLASGDLYTTGDGAARAEKLHIKRAEVTDGLARAEALWAAALERLEAAEGELGDGEQ